MSTASESRLVRVLTCVYEAMLFAYPPAFRQQYRRDMALAFRDHARDVIAAQGVRSLVPLAIHTLTDWATTVTRERLEMSDWTVNRISAFALGGVSSIALLTVLFGTSHVMSGHAAVETDEDIGAHIFQLSIVTLMPFGFAFLATANRKQPLQILWRLAFPATAVLLAFGVLFYFEHVYLPMHGYPPARPGLPLRAFRQMLAAFQ